jgi:transcriptional regulator with XRE-family HTH domain
MHRAKTALQKWMDEHGLNDQHMADRTKSSRSHISRIRRAKSGANKQLALRLQALTGIHWELFIEPKVSIPPDLIRQEEAQTESRG